MNVLTPYYITESNALLTRLVVDIYIYTGTQTTDRGNVVYTIDKTAFDGVATVEISELVKDYIDVNFDGSYTSQMVWVDCIVTPWWGDIEQAYYTLALSAFYGYNYFEEGGNLETPTIMQSNKVIMKNDGENIRIPINASDGNVTIFYRIGAGIVDSDSITTTAESSQVINYASSATNYDNLTVNGEEIKVVTIEQCENEPVKITFINKFGALQDIWMFGRIKSSISTTKEEYKRSLQNYSKHQYKIDKKQGKQKLTLNSGYYPEDYNEVFRQLMLSELVWITYEGQVLPIQITKSTLNYKDRRTDKLIDYTIEIEFAYSKINNI